ncbi:MAG: hypothetical protein QM689_10350 [Oscillospiraceae bacterium]
MAYVAVSGGSEAIDESIRLLDYYRSASEQDVAAEVVIGTLSCCWLIG